VRHVPYQHVQPKDGLMGVRCDLCLGLAKTSTPLLQQTFQRHRATFPFLLSLFPPVSIEGRADLL
jgi:hypothetical protein